MSVNGVLRAGLVLVAGLVVFLMLGEAQRRAGSNYVPEFGPVVDLRGADRHCQAGQLVPGDTGALQLRAGTYGRPTPEFDVTVTAAEGRVVSSGHQAAGRSEGLQAIPLSPVRNTVEGARVCVATGAGGRTLLYGRGRNVRLVWLRSGAESRLSLLPVIADRFGHAKLNPVGPWLLLVPVLLLAAAWIAAFRLVMREAGA